MAPTIPENEPLVIVAGDYVQWTKAGWADYPIADGWALKYRMIGVGLDKTVTAVATDFYTVTFVKADTDAIVSPLVVRLFGWVTKGSERYTVYDEFLKLEPNLETASATNLQTHAVKCVAALEALIEGRLTADMQSYSIDGRAVTKIPIEEAPKLLGIYRAKVWREQHPGQSHPQHAVQFT